MLLTPHYFREPLDQHHRLNRLLIEIRLGISKPQVRRQTFRAVKNHWNIACPEDLRDRRHVSIREMYVENSRANDAGFQQDQGRTGTTDRSDDQAAGVLDR